MQVILSTFILLFFSLPLFATETVKPVEINATEIATDDVIEWSDNLFTKSIADKRVSGVIVSYVKDGQLVFSKSYGSADLKTDAILDPNSSSFRIGSNSKTFVATSIAQLIDRGKISSINDSANQYLKRIQLPNNNGVELTLKHLLTHRTGFENEVFNIGSNKTLDLPLSAEIIESYLPEFINPAGKYSSYNNYGTAILGLIIEDISGQTLQEYLKENIFTPLAMADTYLHTAPEAKKGMTVPYGFASNGEAIAFPHRTVHPFHGPIGGINSTATDMAKYMLAQLDEGRTMEQPLMTEQNFSALHQQLVTNHQASSGFGMIFFTWDWNGTKMFLHGGNWPGSQSGLVMFPEQNSGLFFGILGGYPEIPTIEGIVGSERLKPVEGITVESALSNVGVITDFLTTVIGDYKPTIDPLLTQSDINDFIGYFEPQSAAFTTFEKALAVLQDAGLYIEQSSEGGLRINGVGPYIEVSKDVFWKKNYLTPLDGFFNQSPLYNFTRNTEGKVEYVTPQVGFDAWIKKPITQSPQFNMSIFGIGFLFSLSGLVFVFYNHSTISKQVVRLPIFNALLLVALLLSVLVGYSENDSLLSQIFFGERLRFISFTLLAHIISLFSLANFYYCFNEWKVKGWGSGFSATIKRIHLTVIALSSIGLILFFHFINALII